MTYPDGEIAAQIIDAVDSLKETVVVSENPNSASSSSVASVFKTINKAIQVCAETCFEISILGVLSPNRPLQTSLPTRSAYGFVESVGVCSG